MVTDTKLTVAEKELIRRRLAECISRCQTSDDEDEVTYMYRRAFSDLTDLAYDNVQRIRESREVK